MKTPDEVVAALRSRLTDTWHQDVTAPPGRWPWRPSLAPPKSGAAAADRAAVRAWSYGWHDWAALYHVPLDVANRRIGPLAENLPSHVIIPDIDTAARIAGNPWPQTLAAARRRHTLIAAAFPNADAATALRRAEKLTDTDVELALVAAAWFRDNPTAWPGLTPRQVPVEGLHGKWLNAHLPLLETLTGIPDLTLATRPTRIHYTYVDPGHLAHGGRHHDSHTLGDTATPAYTPDMVLVCENKDTVVMFPPYPGLVVVEGGGSSGPRLLPQIPWLMANPNVYYWGDIDADGFVILNALRQRGISAVSLLMDIATYDRFERFGTDTDRDGRPLAARLRVPTPNLTAAEQALYDDLIDPAWDRKHRIEQERIPLQHALEVLALQLSPTQ